MWSTTARARPPPARATRSVPSPTSACRRASVTSWIRTTAWCPALGGHLQESGLQPEKINLPYLPTPALRQEVWQRLEALGGLVLTSSIPDNIEVNAQGADKGSALRALAERLGIPREKVMALGDNGNDVTMLQYAGVSVAMGDGSPEAKAAARFLTAPHDQNGLAQAVRQYALS